MENEALSIDYKVQPEQFRKIWFDYFKKGLPGMFAFWGTGALLSVLAFYLSAERVFIVLFVVFVTIPFSLVLVGYRNFMKIARENFSSLAEDERNIRMTFQTGSDGFDCVNGGNFGHTTWKSIRSVRELDDCFVFSRAGSVFYIPKTAFRDDSEIRFLRFLISANVNKNVKLLNQKL